MLRRTVLSVAFIFVICSMTGCDQLNKLYETVMAKKDALVQQTAPAAPSTQQASTGTSKAGQEAPAPQVDKANAVVRVGTWSLSRDEFKERLKALQEVMPDFDIKNTDQRKLVMEELIRQQLLVQEAINRGLDKNKDIIMAVEEFRRTLLVRELATQLTQGITATAEEAKEYYDENRTEFIVSGEWHLREIMVDTKDEAKEILIELLKGADFAEMAMARSQSDTAAKGGDLGFITEFPFPQMETAVLTLEDGGVSSVIEGPKGFYIVKLDEKKGGEIQEYEDIKEDIIAGLTLLKQQQAILQQLDTLQQTTEIEINESLL